MASLLSSPSKGLPSPAVILSGHHSFHSVTSASVVSEGKATVTYSSSTSVSVVSSTLKVTEAGAQGRVGSRLRTESESSDDSFIEFSSSVESTNLGDFEGNCDDEDDSEEDEKDSGLPPEDESETDDDICFSWKSKKEVSFDEDNLVTMIEFEDDVESKSNRKVYWEVFARDRAHFRNRIGKIEDILGPILGAAHRSAVFSSRFGEK